jgi:hypothetical protein
MQFQGPFCSEKQVLDGWIAKSAQRNISPQSNTEGTQKWLQLTARREGTDGLGPAEKV